MSQNATSCPNTAGATFRTNVNNAFDTLLTLNSGTAAPGTTSAGMLWYDTTNAVVKQRNATNTGWITRWTVANAEGTLGTNLIFTPDNTYDIGASGATRPRDFFLGRNATIGGTLGVTGTTTLSGSRPRSRERRRAFRHRHDRERRRQPDRPRLQLVEDARGVVRTEREQLQPAHLRDRRLRPVPASARSGRFSTGGYIKASPTASYAGSTGVYHELVQTSTTASDQALAMWHVATAGDNKFILFGTEGSFTSRGSISYNRAGVVVAYNTTSDYRLKDLFGEYADSGALIDAIPVHYGLMKEATVKRPMFLAHEVQAAAPYAVMGEKDAIDDEGEPVYQQLDHQILVPALWAEMRSMRKRVATLEGATLH
jgi:hypothetical protein